MGVSFSSTLYYKQWRYEMDNIKLIKDGLRNLYPLILNSKDKNIKELIDDSIELNGAPCIRYINKKTDNSKYNVIRLYLERNGTKTNFVDVNWGFAEYNKHANKQRVIEAQNQVISWINLDKVYIKLFLEKSPKSEDSSNTQVIIDNTDDVIEMIDNEAQYFAIRCKEIRESCSYLDDVSPEYRIEESDEYCYV
jgi:hypothetical protein